MYTNLASLLAKFDDFVLTVEDISPSFIFICETWLSPRIPDSLVDINGYTIFRSDRMNRAGGGVCVYIKSELLISFSVTPLCLECPNIDTLALKLRSGSFSITLACIYRPPNSSRVDDQILCENISQLAATTPNLVLAGD